MDDLQYLVRTVVFAESVPQARRPDLDLDDYECLRRCMSILPRECLYPRNDAEHYWDSYVKFFLFGDSKDAMPEHVRLINKVGQRRRG